MGPIWVLTALDGPHVGPMNLATRAITYTDGEPVHWHISPGANISIDQYLGRILLFVTCVTWWRTIMYADIITLFDFLVFFSGNHFQSFCSNFNNLVVFIDESILVYNTYGNMQRWHNPGAYTMDSCLYCRYPLICYPFRQLRMLVRNTGEEALK